MECYDRRRLGTNHRIRADRASGPSPSGAGELIIPDAVYEELVGRGTERPGAAEVAHGAWIHRRTVQNLTAVAQLPHALQAGEREAIVLAQELGAQLLIDEHR